MEKRLTEILTEIRNHVAFVTLNRPAALNALSMDMVVGLTAALRECAVDPNVYAILIKGAGEKAFCAGGDIRALYQSFRSGGTMHREFFSVEYPLDYYLRFYSKPYMALMDGITMGGGMGLAQGSPLRLVGDRTKIAMPEVAIGFFPDVGGSFFLSRAPGELGLYLALTGAQIRASDALYAQLADAYLSKESVDRLEGELTRMTWSQNARADLDQLIGSLKSKPPETAPLAQLREVIDLHFGAHTVAAILDSLAREQRPQHVDWARRTAATIATRSPTMLAVTLRQLRLGRSMNFADCLRMEAAMAHRAMDQGDFIEGVRAMIIDKDNSPKWSPDSLATVTDASVAEFFKSPWAAATHPLANLEQVGAL